MRIKQMNQTKYKKSDTCVFCGKKVFNSKRDGNFLCWDCKKIIENEIYDLLKEKSVYKDDIKEVSVYSSSGWGSTHKNTTIKIGYNYGRNIYVILSTAKILEIRDLKDEQLLLDYLESEIKVQYALKGKQINEEYLNNQIYLREFIDKTINTIRERYPNFAEDKILPKIKLKDLKIT